MRALIESVDYWYQLMTSTVQSADIVSAMVYALERENPRICSLIMERACNLQCRHCIFQREKTSVAISQAAGLTRVAQNIVSQMDKNPLVVHEGRILRPWHLDTFSAIRVVRPDARIGLIDNGTFVHCEEDFLRRGLQLDWMDISIDGTKEIHNLQRHSQVAFDQAMEGIRHAREYIQPACDGGKLTSLFTVTNPNFADVYNTAALLLKENLVDEFHITPFSPVRSEIAPLFFCPRYKDGIVDDCAVWWREVQRVWNEFQNEEKNRIFVRVYQHADLEKIARTVGSEKFWAAFTDLETVRVDQGSISFVIDGVRITYVPLSICPSETFVIDADATYRMAYCLQHTLAELRAGKSVGGRDIRAYTVASLNFESNFRQSFKQGAKQWMDNFGHIYLQEEFELFRKIKNGKFESAGDRSTLCPAITPPTVPHSLDRHSCE